MTRAVKAKINKIISGGNRAISQGEKVIFEIHVAQMKLPEKYRKIFKPIIKEAETAIKGGQQVIFDMHTLKMVIETSKEKGEK